MQAFVRSSKTRARRSKGGNDEKICLKWTIKSILRDLEWQDNLVKYDHLNAIGGRREKSEIRGLMHSIRITNR